MLQWLMSEFIESHILNAFVSFAENETLSRTAQELSISQPALTRSMQKLEEIVGVTLFERKGNKLSLNENGFFALRIAKEIMDAQERLIAETRDFAERNESVSFGSIAPAPIDEIVPKLRQRFMNRKIKSELLNTEHELLEKLDAGKFDFVILRDKPDGYFCRELFTERLSVFVPKEHRLAKEKSVTLIDLAGEKLLVLKDLGFWGDVVREKIPDADFFWIEERKHLIDLVNLSKIPSFVTNITEVSVHYRPIETRERIAVPITDSEVNITFYLVCTVEKKTMFEGL